MDFQYLQEDDTPALWHLRRKALEEEPDSFTESLLEMDGMSVQEYAHRLGTGGGDNFVIGAFERGSLVGMAGFYRESPIKRRHKGRVWGVYVSPEYRGLGVGHGLLTRLLERARQVQGLETVSLSVATTREPARRLYARLGFRVFGMEPHALKVDGRYVDEDHMFLDIRGDAR